MPEFDIDAALGFQVPVANDPWHLNTDETALVQAVMQVLLERFGVQDMACNLRRVKAGAKVVISYGYFHDTRPYGGIDQMLDAMEEAVYNCQQRERQIRNLSVGNSYTSFYLYR